MRSLLLGKLHGKLAARTREAIQPDHHLGFKLGSRAGEGLTVHVHTWAPSETGGIYGVRSRRDGRVSPTN